MRSAFVRFVAGGAIICENSHLSPRETFGFYSDLLAPSKARDPRIDPRVSARRAACARRDPAGRARRALAAHAAAVCARSHQPLAARRRIRRKRGLDIHRLRHRGRRHARAVGAYLRRTHRGAPDPAPRCHAPSSRPRGSRLVADRAHRRRVLDAAGGIFRGARDARRERGFRLRRGGGDVRAQRALRRKARADEAAPHQLSQPGAGLPLRSPALNGRSVPSARGPPLEVGHGIRPCARARRALLRGARRPHLRRHGAPEDFDQRQRLGERAGGKPARAFPRLDIPLRRIAGDHAHAALARPAVQGLARANRAAKGASPPAPCRAARSLRDAQGRGGRARYAVSPQARHASALLRHGRGNGAPAFAPRRWALEAFGRRRRRGSLRSNLANMPATQSPPDPAESARVFAEVAERSGRIMREFLQRQAGGQGVATGDEFGVARAFTDLAARMLADPWKVAEMQTKMFWDHVALWQSSLLRMLGKEVPSVAEAAKGDNRFRDAGWQDQFLFDYIKQSYLIAARHLHDAVSSVDGLSEETRKKVNFYTRQYIDALSPSHFALTNPEVLRETLHSGGQNLLKGLNNLLADIERGGIRMADEKAFELGLNIATTPGKVVFQNELMQLIQYAPGTQTVFKRPLLVIPPWINKYYILDLREKNSFVRWAVEQGHTVFVISWVNPDGRYAGKTFENYMFEGPLAALDAIGRATGESDVNVIGYCLGGTLLCATVAWMAQKNDRRASSATFFASLLDFSIPGELGVFIDEAQVENLERRMQERGYLEGSEMAATFNMLRANDLVWSFVVNNYLLGKDPFPFDLLYWNSDSTRMPAAMHSFYLRKMYQENQLVVPGGITLGGVPIDVRKITTPTFIMASREDHIAPWKTCYVGTQLFGGPTRFVLGGSGHIAGIVNPPSAKKYGYWTRSELPQSADGGFTMPAM